jgi:UDP-glucose 4-epimerase
MKRILVTGVSGFIGRHVAEEALRRGYHVTGVDRYASRIGGVEFIEADIRHRDRMVQALAGTDYVIHLAAITSNVEFMKKPADCYDINVNGFLSVIDAAGRCGCERLVYASSAAVYVDSFSERATIDFRAQTNHYAKTKMMNEMMAKSYEDVLEIKATGLRYFNVYGNGENEKGDYASIVTLFLKAKKNGEPLVVYGDGTQARDLVNVTDAARITLDALEKGSYDIYNIGTGVATAYRTIAEMIDKERIRYVPNPLPSYQYYTRAETGRVREIVGDYELRGLPGAIAEMSERYLP